MIIICCQGLIICHVIRGVVDIDVPDEDGVAVATPQRQSTWTGVGGRKHRTEQGILFRSSDEKTIAGEPLLRQVQFLAPSRNVR